MLSLNTRIFAAIAIICAVALVGVGMYSTRVTFLQIESAPPGTSAGNQRVDTVRRALESYALAHPAFDGVQLFLQNLGRRINGTIILVTPSLKPIATSLDDQHAATIARAGPDTLAVSMRRSGAADELYLRGGIPVTGHNGRVVGYFFTFAEPQPPAAILVARSANRALWMAVAIALLATLVVGTLVSRYIAGPVRELAGAAAEMTRGNLKRRVAIRGNDDLARLGASFNAMAEAVHRTEQLRRRMVTDVAHELRSPLTRMRAQLEAAQDGHMQGSDALAAIYAETLTLEHLVNDLRDLSLADAGKLHFENSRVDVDSCIDAVLARVAATAELRGIRIVRDVAAGLPAITGDAARIRQVLANLIDNALTHTPSGGHVVVGAAAAQSFVEVFVQDDGPGVPAASAPSVFDRFYRVDGSRSRQTGGSGLGLAIAKELTELQGGTIALETSDGAGARFTCRFPRYTASSSPDS